MSGGVAGHVPWGAAGALLRGERQAEEARGAVERGARQRRVQPVPGHLEEPVARARRGDLLGGAAHPGAVAAHGGPDVDHGRVQLPLRRGQRVGLGPDERVRDLWLTPAEADDGSVAVGVGRRDGAEYATSNIHANWVDSAAAAVMWILWHFVQEE